MSYRERAVEAVKVFGQELVDRAEELVPEATRVKGLNIWIRIPSLSDNLNDIPEIEVSVDVFPKRDTIREFRNRLNDEVGP